MQNAKAIDTSEEIIFNDNELIDNTIKTWLYNKKIKKKIISIVFKNNMISENINKM